MGKGWGQELGLARFGGGGGGENHMLMSGRITPTIGAPPTPPSYALELSCYLSVGLQIGD